MNWHIGCSGFHYKHWKGTFYPEKLAQSKWFDYYCRFFNTLELNVTFYRFPQLSFLQNWYLKSPSGFHFAVKAPRLITHYKQFSGVADMTSDFYHTIREGLKEKLGCVLFQMPPRFSFSRERLEKIIRSVDNSYPNVLEFRHQTWWREDVYNTLRAHNISFCGMSHPILPPEVISNTSLLYYRLHGMEQLYASNYEEQQLSALIETIRKNANTTDAYIFFNNDINTFAVHNGLLMNRLAGIEPPEKNPFNGI
ncbi:uncharacterized protein YecE (DUF72 family) [Arcticibacter tournemirensis]|uniref:DUF72 domain-containing protein n=1 Tax=Arcticibacter tournemirensis TaxID=699437 RepID=A0A5M9HIB3_9SPHI|nr:DUF72 domain-containing protein [Arcticibacter tournemirensis]KAA8486772.1 DUF72 domain-containing protein [Arcticibacter tournemirensis]TQM49315.1 uncharacterized protein YecE (DUF72 family) [Arcticibacter tournemirensis]